MLSYHQVFFKCLIILIYIHQQIAFGYEQKIVNGTAALPGEFPFMISLRYSSSGRHVCGASLLNRVWALTAAHCVKRFEAFQLNIQYDSNVLQVNSSKVSNVSHIYVHEGYNNSNRFIHDIALLRLAKPLKLKGNFRSIRLPEFNSLIPNETPAILIGWGLNGTGGMIQKCLQKVDLQIFDDQNCSERYDLKLHNSTICAGVPEGGKGQCNGDSGGPLLINDTQVGIVSWSRKPCTRPPYPGVSIRYVGNSSKQHICAGTLINSLWVLTAAHCFKFIKTPQDLLVQYGTNLLVIEESYHSKFANVSAFYLHEGYNPTIAIHDLALIRLKANLIFNNNTRNVRLPDDHEENNYENLKVNLVGWGSDKTFGSLQKQLEKVSLNTVERQRCVQLLNSIVHRTNLCASDLYKGQCSGDSGGPLLYNNIQIGIVSWSLKPCASKPGIFTNLSYYTKWIKTITEK
uniref:Peptidase S1 domain-containing protein n=1 Tax=Glossina brevipalpis TaxID=37001 RepID=A0A1A9X1D6_9MUSC